MPWTFLAVVALIVFALFRGGWIVLGIATAGFLFAAFSLAGMVAGAHDPASAGAGIMVGVIVLGPIGLILVFRALALMAR